jgi:hypothetical protein
MHFQTKTLFNVAHGRPVPNSKKSVWNKVGILIVDPDNDRISLHLDSIPTGEWNGWLSIFPKETDKAQTAHTPASSPDDFDDSVPF